MIKFFLNQRSKWDSVQKFNHIQPWWMKLWNFITFFLSIAQSSSSDFEREFERSWSQKKPRDNRKRAPPKLPVQLAHEPPAPLNAQSPADGLVVARGDIVCHLVGGRRYARRPRFQHPVTARRVHSINDIRFYDLFHRALRTDKTLVLDVLLSWST